MLGGIWLDGRTLDVLCQKSAGLWDFENDLTKMHKRLKTIVENERFAHFDIVRVLRYTYEIEHSHIAPQKWWLEDYFPFGMTTVFRGTLLNFGSVNHHQHDLLM